MSTAVNRMDKDFARIVLISLLLVAVHGTVAAQTSRGTYVTTSDVQVRKGPGTNYDVVITIPAGIKVNVVGREGYWLKIESKHGNAPGYIDEQYARPLDSAQQTAQTKTASRSVAGVYRTIADVDLREGPGMQHRIMQKLPEGMRVNVVRAEGEWMRIESKRGNKPGYIEKRFLERVTER